MPLSYYEYRWSTIVLLGNKKERQARSKSRWGRFYNHQEKCHQPIVSNATLKPYLIVFCSSQSTDDVIDAISRRDDIHICLFVAAIPVTHAYHYPFRKWGELCDAVVFPVCCQRTNRLPLRGHGALAHWSFLLWKGGRRNINLKIGDSFVRPSRNKYSYEHFTNIISRRLFLFAG